MTIYRDEALLRLCYAGMMCVAIGTSLIPVYLTTLSEAMGGLAEGQMGLMAGLLYAGFVSGILLSGPLADRVGAKPFCLAGAGFSAAGLILLADAFSFPTLLAACFVTGFGAGVIDMVMSPIVSALSVANRAAALNRLHAFYCAGALSTLLIASLLIRLDVNWRVVMIGFAAAPALVLAGFAVEPVPPLVSRGNKRLRLRQLARMPLFYAGLIGILLIGATEEGMAQWLPAYAERELGFSKAAAGLGLGGFALAMGSGRLLASGYGRNLPGRLLVVGGALLCSAGFAAAATLGPSAPGVALGACVLVGLGCSVLWPTALAMAAEAFPQGGATLFAAMSAAGNAGCLLAPYICGLLAEQIGLRAALGLGAAYPLLLVFFLMFGDRMGFARR